MNLRTTPAHTIRDAIRDGSVTARKAAEDVIAAIDQDESTLSCYLHRRSAEETVAEAEKIDALRKAGRELPPLAGIAAALKDNIAFRGMPTTCGSLILEDFHSLFNATAAEKIKSAGAIIVGKTNMDEFAMGSSTENSAYRPTRNPWDTDRVPGGSSGGSCAAVASGEALLALGSDTGGSIRQPAAFCGVVGLKPTYGTVSRYGLVAFASSFDQIGPVGRCVTDVAMLFDVIAGADERDSTTARRDHAPTEDRLTGEIDGLRVGVAEQYFSDGLDDEVARSVRKGIELLRERGATIVEISLQRNPFAIPAYYIAANAEASANLARYDGVRYGLSDRGGESLAGMYRRSRRAGFGDEVKRRILLGTYALSSGYYDDYYDRAMKVRSLITDEFREALQSCDVIAGPTTPTTAFRLGEKSGDPLSMYLSDVYTISANLAGLPAVTLPCGLDSAGLPIGIQLTGRPFEEGLLLNTARAIEIDTPPIGIPGKAGK